MTWQSPTAQPPLRPLSVGEILDVTFRLYRENFLPMIKIAAIGVVPTQVLTLLLLLSAVPDDEVTRTTTDAFGNEQLVVESGDVWRFVAATIVIGLLSVAANLIVSAAMTKAVAHAYVDRTPVDIGASFRAALGRFFPLLGMTLLFGLGVGLGTVACILPGVFLYVAWSVSAPALVMEDAGAGRALTRSMALVKPRWWPTFGLLILVFIMTSIAQQIISTPISLIAGGGSGMFGSGLDADAGFATVFVGSTLAGIISGLLTTPFSAIVTVVLYVDLRVRHEGFDIAVMARSLGDSGSAAPTAAAPPPPPPVVPPTDPDGPPEPPRWGASPPSGS